MEKYKPSSEEVARAKGMMADEQKGMSEQREKEYESISMEDVQEMIEKILLKRDLAGEGDVEVLYKKLNEYAARENINATFNLLVQHSLGKISYNLIEFWYGKSLQIRK